MMISLNKWNERVFTHRLFRSIFTVLNSHIYLMILTANAVVCGGMLAVMKVACSTLTLNPGTSEEIGILLPKGSMITVFSEILNRIAEDGF